MRAATDTWNRSSKVWVLIALVLVVSVAHDAVSRRYTVTNAAYVVGTDLNSGAPPAPTLIGGPYPTDCGSGLRVMVTGGSLSGCAGNRDPALGRLVVGMAMAAGAGLMARRPTRKARAGLQPSFGG